MILSVLLVVLTAGQDCQETQARAHRAYDERRYDAAAQDFGSAVTACGPGAPLLLALGQAQLLARHPADALASLDRIQADKPEYVQALKGNFADLLIKLGNFQRAFDLAAEAAQRNTGEPRNFFLAGKALVQAERSDLAVRWFEQAIKLDPDYPEPHYLLSQAFRKLGKLADADRELKSFQAATARAPRERR